METYHIYISHLGGHYTLTETEIEDYEEYEFYSCEQCGDWDWFAGTLTLPHEPTEEEINTLLQQDYEGN